MGRFQALTHRKAPSLQGFERVESCSKSDGLFGWRLKAGGSDAILKGAKPYDLAVEHATKVELVCNLRTAKALDLTVPTTLLTRAGEVIE